MSLRSCRLRLLIRQSDGFRNGSTHPTGLLGHNLTGTNKGDAFMPRQFAQYRVFIGSPGGLQEEREAFRRVLTTFNEHHGEANGIVFAPVGWEDTLGGVGRPQELINEDLRQCDFAIFVFHDRWGSPTGSASIVGTEEEWRLALELYEKKTIRKICLFFKHIDLSKLADPGAQLQQVLNFKTEIEKEKKHLFLAYGDVPSYCTALEKHIASWMRDIAGTAGKHLATLSQRSSDDKPAPASEIEPSFSFWLNHARQLSEQNTPHTDLAGARFCAAMALDLASTDAEWADAENTRAMALEDLVQSFDSFSEVAVRFFNSRDPVLQSKGARALFNKGITLGQLGRREEAIAVYDDVVGRFGTATETALHELVARALFNKGVRLGELGRLEDEVAVYEDIVNRFETAVEAFFRQQVARALFNKGVSLGELGRVEEEIAVYDDIVNRFGTAAEIALREQVAEALVNKGVRLGHLDRDEEAIAVYDNVVDQFGMAAENTLREEVVRALVNKGVSLGKLGRSKEEIAVYDDVVDQLRTAVEPGLREGVARALVNKGVTLGQLGRDEEAIAVYDNVVSRFGTAAEIALREQVASALGHKSVKLGRLGRYEEAIAVSDDVVGRFGTAAETTLRERVARELVNKGIALGELGRGVEATAVYDDVVGRFGTAAETSIRDCVQRATTLRASLGAVARRAQ
jgi:tetratricopeptide (TPR) repeat protein